MKLCYKCGKRPAVVFITEMNQNGVATSNEPKGLCLVCAKEAGIQPINEMLEKMNISDEEIEQMSDQFMDIMSLGDENGDDEYIPSVLYYEPIEATIEFVFKGTIAQAKTQIIAFISYLQGGEFKFYDEFYQKGYGRVRVLKLSDAEFVYDCGDTDKGVATFSVVLKINDPVTDIVLRYEGI